MKVPYYFSFPKAVAKNIHIIPKNLMKSGSFEIKNNIFDNNINSFNNNIKRRAHSNIINQSFLDIFNNNNYENKGKNVNNRNQSNISSLLSLKQTEKDEIMKEYNIIKNKKIRTKPSNKKKINETNNIFLSNNNYESSKKNFSTAKSKLSQKKAKYNSAKISSIPISSFKKNSNKSNNIRLKKSRLNIINNEKEPKYKINNSFINNNPFTKYEQKSDRIKSIYINKNSSISTNTHSNSLNKTQSDITFGTINSYKIPSEFVYIKKNNLCYSNSYNSKNESHLNSNSLSRTLNSKIEENCIQKAINDVNISEFRIAEEKDSFDEKNSMENINDENDITEEENRSNINKINISYIGKYKTIGQIEKKIEGENAINRIIINNLKKKVPNLKICQNNKIKLIPNNQEINSKFLDTATFGLKETEKKY